jgi:hypothetical protein
MSDLFAIAARHLERHCDLDALEARGTLRIALKAGGVDARDLDASQLQAVLSHLMPRELKARGVVDAETVCRAVARDVAVEWRAQDSARPERPDDVLRRLGGD